MKLNMFDKPHPAPRSETHLNIVALMRHAEQVEDGITRIACQRVLDVLGLSTEPVPHTRLDKNQLPGFRKTDPSTSKKAAFDVMPRTGSMRRYALMAVMSAGENGATYEDVARATAMNGAWKRLSELKQGGWVVAAGERKISTGSKATIYKVSEKGREALKGDYAQRPLSQVWS